MAGENVYDLILLDILLPGLDGFWALRTLRQAGHTALIFMMTAQAGEPERLTAYEAGADDYIVKPFFFRELVARIRRWFQRRSQFLSSASPSTDLTTGNIKLDLLKHRATMNGRFIPLTPKEFMILEYLIRHAGRVVTQTALEQAVWNSDFETGTNVVEVHINRLRKKIDENGKPSIIQTVRGSGYLMEKDPS